MHQLGAAVSRLAVAVIEIGSDLRISPYLSDTSQPSLERSAWRVITANREGFSHIVCAIRVSWNRKRFDDIT